MVRHLTVGDLFPHDNHPEERIEKVSVMVENDKHQLSAVFSANPNTGFVKSFPVNTIFVCQEKPR
jgi:hypothetical protein